MKTVNLQVRINEDLKQEVSSILKAQGLSYTSMLDALFRQIIKERRIPFAIALPTAPIDETPTPSTLNNGTYEQPQTTLKASETINRYGNYGNVTPNEGEVAFDTIDKTGVLNIRINPKVKTLTTAILKEMGLTMSLLVTLISKQIQFLKAIPSSVNKPIACDSMNADFLTNEEIDQLLELAYKDIEQGNLTPAEDLFEQLKKEGLLS
ncbi:type II toxin-antitoxin system RelB/DinJ family antitoxin [Veillonella parvula]|uniref:type II toxin-antitoxin system RelB/DinJ family antitoxin n=2 Tax=Veillonella TaxID=29465 RepID=UPI0026F20456|nr:type II toxin-antitoxin system RelB/DinJ family antitoxin [Veillonella parvula]